MSEKQETTLADHSCLETGETSQAETNSQEGHNDNTPPEGGKS